MHRRLTKQYLLRIQVMTTDDYNKWNFDVLYDIVEGPLLNAKRLDEAVKASKFMRRLMSFYLPFNQRFSRIKKSPASRTPSSITSIQLNYESRLI